MELAANELKSANRTLKVAAKMLLRNDDLVFLLKAMKIALDASALRRFKVYDRIFRLLPAIIAAPDPVVLDIGANMGQFAARISRQFPAGRIYCFEPVHSNAVGLERVRTWLRLRNVSIFEQAMCDAVGAEPIHIPTFNGAYRDGALAVLEGSKHAYDNIGYHVEMVSTGTIDAFVAAHRIERVDFIKVDTEGAEERVVRGGLQTIVRLLPTLYLETLPDRPWLDLLYEQGYRPFYNDGVTLHRPRAGERQTDVLLVHCSRLHSLGALLPALNAS